MTVMIVVPCYNEAKRLDVEAFAAHASLSFLFVNDGSTDNTQAIIEAASSAHGHLHAMSLAKNAGKGEAVRQGLQRALVGADIVGFFDADLATSLAELDQLVTMLANNTALDVVLASRIRMLGRDIERTPVRHYLGRVFATIASMTLRLPIYDSQCGAKVFRNTPALHQALSAPMTTRWTFDVELLLRLLHAGLDATRMSEMPLQAWADKRGGTLGMTAMVAAGRDLMRLWWQSRRR